MDLYSQSAVSLLLDLLHNMYSYYTIHNAVEQVLYKDKASKFYGFAYPVKNEIEIKEKLEFVKAQHPKATHHCYAYRIGIDKNNYRANDDGEPSGTAGKPILGQIDSFGVTNCLIIVVRYFGGTKLGVTGLIDAYKSCAKETLQNTNIVLQQIRKNYLIQCDYTVTHAIFSLIQKVNATIENQELEQQSTFVISIEQQYALELEQQFEALKISLKHAMEIKKIEE